MKPKGIYVLAAAFLLTGIVPARALPQSQTPNDEAQQLRKLVEQMQAQMTKMQAEIDQLQGAKAAAPPG